jgi:hypothetical protein
MTPDQLSIINQHSDFTRLGLYAAVLKKRHDVSIQSLGQDCMCSWSAQCSTSPTDAGHGIKPWEQPEHILVEA